jgi:hemerythrin
VTVRLAELARWHEELEARRARLLAGLVDGDCSEVHEIVELLQVHVLEHFGLEERWMAEAGYPDLAAHKAEHDAFMREYVRFAVAVEKKGATRLLAMRVANWLGGWLRDHVAGPDGELGRFLGQRTDGQAPDAAAC